LLLDTRAAIWLVNGDPMSADSRASITAAQRGKSRVYVTPMRRGGSLPWSPRTGSNSPFRQRLVSMRWWGWRV